MRVHAERSLTENLMAFAGLFERNAHVGLTVTPEGVAALLRSLQVMTAQAQRVENTVRELTQELVEEASLPTTFGQVKPAELIGTPSQRIEWLAVETAQCASRIARSEAQDRGELASHLRYIANQSMAMAETLHDAEQAASRSGVRGWVRGVIDGGRA